MSNETREALDDALRAHIADETGGGLLCDWVMVAAAIPQEGTKTMHYLYVAPTGPPHNKLGLLDAGIGYYAPKCHGNRSQENS